MECSAEMAASLLLSVERIFVQCVSITIVRLDKCLIVHEITVVQ